MAGEKVLSKLQRTVLILTSGVALLALMVYLVPARELASDLIVKVRNYGVVAPLVYFFLFVVAGVAGFSRTLMTIIAGILFSPVVAFVAVMTGLMTTFIITFVVARYFAAEWVAARLEKIAIAKALMAAVEDQGFRLLVLMRLNPFVPGVVNGYGFGLTSISPRIYFLASLLGTLPLTIVYIYLGWAGGESVLYADAAARDLQTGTLIFGIVFSVILLIGISWYGRRAVAAASKHEP